MGPLASPVMALGASLTFGPPSLDSVSKTRTTLCQLSTRKTIAAATKRTATALTTDLIPTKTATRPTETTKARTTPHQGPRLLLKFSPRIWMASTNPQIATTPAVTGYWNIQFWVVRLLSLVNETSAAARERGIVIIMTAAAKMLLPKKEVILPPVISLKSKKSCPKFCNTA